MRKALVVGIGNIEGMKLQGAINDANAIATLVATNGNGSPNFSVKQITDSDKAITKADLKGAIKSLFEGNHDTALLYFSGHGFLNDIGGYIVTSDAVKNDEGISMDEILIMANNSDIKNKVIILDCCHSGKFGDSSLIGEGKTIITKGVTILTASKDSESAVEINGQGVFTALLIQALSGGASDLRGDITPGSIYAYIDQALGPWAQRPVFKTNISEFVKLREINPPIPVETLRKITKYFSSPEEQFDLDPSYEDTNNPKIEHKVIDPNAKPEHVAIFKDLQKMQSVGLVVPEDADYMYFAAMDSKSCRLTALGNHYWNLVKNGKI